MYIRSKSAVSKRKYSAITSMKSTVWYWCSNLPKDWLPPQKACWMNVFSTETHEQNCNCLLPCLQKVLIKRINILLACDFYQNIVNKSVNQLLTLSKSRNSSLRTSEIGSFKYSANSSIPILPPLEALAIAAKVSNCSLTWFHFRLCKHEREEIFLYCSSRTDGISVGVITVFKDEKLPNRAWVYSISNAVLQTRNFTLYQ